MVIFSALRSLRDCATVGEDHRCAKFGDTRWIIHQFCEQQYLFPSVGRSNPAI